MVIIWDRPTIIPGSRPAMNSCPTDKLAMDANKINMMLGGIIGPMVEDAAVTTTEKSSS